MGIQRFVLTEEFLRDVEPELFRRWLLDRFAEVRDETGPGTLALTIDWTKERLR